MEPSEFLQIIKTRRSIRQFQPKPIPLSILTECVNCARLAPSARNLQPIEYFLVTEPATVDRIFPLLSWAGYIHPAGNPQPGQHPIAYLVVLLNKARLQSHYVNDVGAAIENFLLAAWAYGIATCWIGSVKREELRQILEIPQEYEIDSVVACGYPAETSYQVDREDEVRYWKDADQKFFVPKRPLDKILHTNKW